MFKLTVEYSTHEELLAAVLALGGEGVVQTPLQEKISKAEDTVAAVKGKPGRKSAAEKKEATATATANGFSAPTAPAAVGATSAPKKTVDDLKAAIRAASKGDTVKIGAFVASLGVEKISDLAQAQIEEIFEEGQIAAFFAAPVATDPMS